MTLFQNKYRTQTVRLKNYNYAQNGSYFVTICTKNRENFFGKIVDGKMIVNNLGNFAKKCWQEIVLHYPQVQLGEFVVMPNHVHGIIIIDDDCGDNKNAINRRGAINHRGAINRASAGGITGQKNPMLNPNCLGAIIRAFKSRATQKIRLIDPQFSWQSNYHEHIIRNEKSEQRISEYIIENPQNWNTDKNYFFRKQTNNQKSRKKLKNLNF